MKILKPGREQKGWSKEIKCSGDGNGGGGCGALLLVEQPDLYRTFIHCGNETDTYVTFACTSCRVETDVKGVPAMIELNLPSKREWRTREESGR